MSHHLDSPIARQDIRVDITHLYVFRGGTGTVFSINVRHSIFGPIPERGYHPERMAYTDVCPVRSHLSCRETTHPKGVPDVRTQRE
jgi:hypothetical protein